jgi:hypothetical protein
MMNHGEQPSDPVLPRAVADALKRVGLIEDRLTTVEELMVGKLDRVGGLWVDGVVQKVEAARKDVAETNQRSKQNYRIQLGGVALLAAIALHNFGLLQYAVSIATGGAVKVP